MTLDDATARAHADTVGHPSVAWCGFGRGGDVHSDWCISRADAIRRGIASLSRYLAEARASLSRVEWERDGAMDRSLLSEERMMQALDWRDEQRARADAAEAERDELRGLVEEARAELQNHAMLPVLQRKMRAFLAPQPIPEGTPGEGKGRL